MADTFAIAEDLEIVVPIEALAGNVVGTMEAPSVGTWPPWAGYGGVEATDASFGVGAGPGVMSPRPSSRSR